MLLRVLAGAAAGVVSLAIGLAAMGAFEPAPVPGEVPPGSNAFMLVLAVALLVAFLAYAATEWAQTGSVASVARQLDTRTIVFLPVAIALNVAVGQTVAVALKLPVYLDSIGTIVVGVLAGPIAGALTGLLSNLAWTFLLGGTPFGSPFAWPFAIVAAEIGLVAGVFGYVGVFRSRPNTPRARLAGWVAAALGVLGAIAWFGVLPFYRGLCDGGASTPGGLCFGLFTPGADPLFQVLAAALAALVVLALAAVVWRLVRTRDAGVAIVLVAGAACGVVSALIAAPIAALVFGGVTGSGTDLLVAAFQQAGSDLQTAVLQQALISDPIDKAITFVVVFTILTAASRRVVARFPQGERALGTIEA